MAYFKSIFLYVAILIHCEFNGVFIKSQNFEDISPLPTVFESRTLPVDENGNFLPRYMASVGNGHVATTVYTDTVYMNGLYNGERGESHRARIPSGNFIRMNPPSAQVQNQTFALDVAKGVFFERLTVGGARVEQRTFAHRYYTKVIVTQLQVTTGTESITFPLISSSGDPSADLSTPETGDFGTQLGARYMCAEIVQREDVRYQETIPKACSISTAVPTEVTFPPSSTIIQTFITAYGFNLESIEADFNAVVNLIVSGQHNEVYDTHVRAWTDLWTDGAIEVKGNDQLAKVVYGSLYYILSSLPVTTETNSPNEQFYGLSPGGLAYGSLLMDYQGHSFWDTETWMYPTVLYLYPDAAREILSYRLAVTRASRDHANETGYKGARFVWESAATGREVTPDCCPETRDLQVHITSDISFAIRQYISMTRDLEWLKETKENYVTNACGLLRDIAEFWTSRSTYNASTRFYDIKGVMPPDEDNHGVDNNGYTNIGAGYSIFYAKYAECLCGTSMDMEVPEEWLDLAKSLKLLYDEELDYHPEFEGYVFGTPIKQADVVLMGFPQLYDMPAATRRNDLLVYANVTREDGPAMTWAMHTIGFLELNDLEEAAEIFNKSYQLYLREPFKVWTEAKPPTLGAINFITGMGGFLQSIFSGYGGLRVFPEKITITKPRVLPDSSGLKLTGIKYLGNVIDADISPTNITLTLRQSSSGFPLTVSSNDGSPIDFVDSITYSTQVGELQLEISSKTPTNCELPYDKIGAQRQRPARRG
ncbi:unnamed protein product [Orchesella dallaii]|uniref:Glycoside hydrolase family 65 central catalytic domain-containing protein n=1 Tax=Orchesella dallaii TaxID=48710 RepID=A0ABP1R9A5_9HEXA